MSLPNLLGVAALLLLAPLVLGPRPRGPWEFRGFLALLWYVNAAYCAIVYRLRTEAAPLPERGPAILIANHTCNIDSFLLQAGTGRLLGFLIARQYYDNPLFHLPCKMIGCIPVNSDGREIAATKASLRALSEGRVLPLFPEGQMLTTSGREIGQAKLGVALIALKSRVPVIPAYIRGTPRSKNVWVSLTTPSSARVVYGPPIEADEYAPLAEGLGDQRAAWAATTARFMAAIHALRDREVARDPEDPPFG